MLKRSVIALSLLLSGVAGACSRSPTTPPPNPRGSQVVIESRPDISLQVNFNLTTTIDNPCGNFSGPVIEEAAPRFLRFFCIIDSRTAFLTITGFEGEIRAPEQAPWMSGLDIITGEDLGRIETGKCSDTRDDLELALGGRLALVDCTRRKSDWRVILKNPDETARKITLPTDSSYFRIGQRIVRQRYPGQTWTKAEFAEPLSDSELIWKPISPLRSARECIHAMIPSINRERLMVRIGKSEKVAQGPSQGTEACVDFQYAVIDPADGAIKLIGGPWESGKGPHVSSDDRFLYDTLDFGSEQILFETGAGTSFQTSAIRGMSLKGRKLNLHVAERIVALEIMPRIRLGERPFRYVILDWNAQPLARFNASIVSISPSGSRLFVTYGDKIEVWDRKL